MARFPSDSPSDSVPLTYSSALFPYYQKEQLLPKEDRYLWAFRATGRHPLIVAMDPFLAEQIHDATSLACDFTYKRIHGELQEWEMAMYSHRFQRCAFSPSQPTEQNLTCLNIGITVARVFGCVHSAADFQSLWEAVLDVLKEITGKPLSIPALHGGRGKLGGICLDADGGQALGFARTLLKAGPIPVIQAIADPEEREREILLFILICCLWHFG